jgi:hypothetical protein
MTNYHLAQLNIARFIKPSDHEDNRDFHANLDLVNAAAERAPGFVWRLVGEGNDATDIQAFDDPDMIVNLSVWESPAALSAFVYRNEAHRDIMRRRGEWFRHIEPSLVLWWVREGWHPTIKEAKNRLEYLGKHGPGPDAFTFKQLFKQPE